MEYMKKQETVIQDQVSRAENSMKMCEKYAKDQVRAIEHSVQQQKASYADTVKSTCCEVAKVVKSQIVSIPKPNHEYGQKTAQDLSKVLDDHLDKERRKANLVIHNLPEQQGSSLTERSEKDVAAFSTMIKDVMKLHVTSSKSFRVGKRQDRPRLLIITLDNPACKQDILRYATRLRNSR